MVYTPDLLRQIGARHRIPGEPTLMPAGGMVNEAWLLGDDVVVRISFREDCDNEALIEEAVVPVVAEAGIKTPRLIAADHSLEIAPRPYTVYQRARGTLLGYLEPEHHRFEIAYRELGAEIAKLHAIEPPRGILQKLAEPHDPDPRKSLQKAVDTGKLVESDARDIEAFLGVLEEIKGETQRFALSHQDIHPWNLLVDGSALSAIIDWGDSSIADPAYEFSSMPLDAVPAMLDGYRGAGGAYDQAFLARSFYLGVSLALWELREIVGVLEDRFDRRWLRFHPDGWTAMRRRMEALLGRG